MSSSWSTQPPANSNAISQDSRQWGLAAHVGSFLAAYVALGILCPIIVALAKGRDAFVRHHAYESLNFQLNALVWIAISVVLMFVGIGFVLIAIVGIWYLVFVIIAGMAAYRGEWYRYPAIVRIFTP